MRSEYPVKRCKKCDKPLRDFNKSGICTNCKKNKWKDKYDVLKKEFDRHKELCRIVMLDYYKRLKKYEPNIKWEDENE